MIGFGEEGTGGKYTLENGEYFWRIVEKMETKNGKVFTTHDTTSNKGDPQIALVVQVGDSDGTINVLETLTGSKKAGYRISQFLRSAGAYPGHGKPYSLNAKKAIGMSGRCKTVNEVPEGSQYERTRINEWIDADKQNPELVKLITPTDTELAMESNRKQEPEPDYSDDIPFK